MKKEDLILNLVNKLLESENTTDYKSTESINNSSIDSFVIGKKSIVRTYSAGVWFGEVSIKEGNQIILKDARRLYKWVTNGGISLSEVSLTGLSDDSKVCAKVDNVFLEAIEIIPCTDSAINSIQGKKNYVN